MGKWRKTKIMGCVSISVFLLPMSIHRPLLLDPPALPVNLQVREFSSTTGIGFSQSVSSLTRYEPVVQWQENSGRQSTKKNFHPFLYTALVAQLPTECIWSLPPCPHINCFLVKSSAWLPVADFCSFHSPVKEVEIIWQWMNPSYPCLPIQIQGEMLDQNGGTNPTNENNKQKENNVEKLFTNAFFSWVLLMTFMNYWITSCIIQAFLCSLYYHADPLGPGISQLARCALAFCASSMLINRENCWAPGLYSVDCYLVSGAILPEKLSLDYFQLHSRSHTAAQLRHSW